MTNKPSLSFDDVEDGASVLQELELSADDVREGRRVPLRFVRFQSVNSLHVRASSLPSSVWFWRCAGCSLLTGDVQIFVVSNQGGEDETRIDSIDIFGMPLQYVPLCETAYE